MKTSIGRNIIMRVEMRAAEPQFASLAAIINELHGDIIAVDLIQANVDFSIRDITASFSRSVEIEVIQAALNKLSGTRLINVSDRTFLLHLGGKISVQPKITIQNRDDLSRVYTPDVAKVCLAIKEDQKKSFTFTVKRNSVAVISDGSAVLGLGNIGPYAGMPVMEGKAMLFKQFADVDAYPICLDTQDTEAIIQTIKHIAPGFGGINLEDISSPRCFEIESRLREELDIPVFHDDQHGTAVVVLAGLINALKLVGKRLEDIKVVICGIGAAGVACTKILLSAGVRNIICYDRVGALVSGNSYEHEMWDWCADNTNPHKETGSLSDIIAGADVFIGVSKGKVLTREDVMRMAKDPIVFAMANPEPEILPEEIDDIVGVVATGRSDYPNQINNVLCFPGIFRAALDCRATTINEAMKLAAARAIAETISEEERTRYSIIPSVFNKKVVEMVRDRVIRAAMETQVSRRIPVEYR